MANNAASDEIAILVEELRTASPFRSLELAHRLNVLTRRKRMVPLAPDFPYPDEPLPAEPGPNFEE